MALSSIDVKVIGYYVWDDDLQTYHENKISDFKYYLSGWLEKLGCIPSRISLNINVDYYPETGKFKFTFINTRENEVLRALKEDFEFSNKYFDKL